MKNSDLPFGIQKVTIEKSVIDWQLNAFEDNIQDLTFVGGYGIDRVIKEYPNFIYVYNDIWMNSGPCMSLLHALGQLPHLIETEYDLCILYSDILVRKELINKIFKTEYCNKQVSVVTDDYRGEYTPETLLIGGSKKKEFVGVVHIPHIQKNNILKCLQENITELKNERLSILFESKYQKYYGNRLRLINANSEWAHVEEHTTISKFILGSKAKTLDRLKSQLKHSTVLPLIYFNRAEYAKNSQSIIEVLSKVFNL